MTVITANPFIAAFAGEAALITPESELRFQACLEGLMRGEHAAQMLAERMDEGDGFWPEPDSWRAQYRPYLVDAKGVLQIPIKGVLLNNFPWQDGGWATGYEYIWRAFKRGMEDPQVRAIALVCDSPGGMVAGNFDLVDRMFAMRGTKPIAGFASESAYSACYNIITVADPGSIHVSRTGGVGSIGIVTSHYDLSGFYEQRGVKITWLFESDGKVDGNSSEPLSDRARKRIMARIGKLYGVFVSSVARNRGMDEESVRALKSFTYDADEAVSNGLADKIGPLDEALTAFAAGLDEVSDEGDEEMATPNTAVEQAAAPDPAALAAATASGETTERARIGAILNCEEAKGRETLANHIAFNTAMSADDAKGMLAASPKTEAASAQQTPTSPAPADNASATFAAAMDATGNPNVGGGDSGEQGGGAGAANPDSADPILALISAAGLSGFKQAK